MRRLRYCVKLVHVPADGSRLQTCQCALAAAQVPTVAAALCRRGVQGRVGCENWGRIGDDAAAAAAAGLALGAVVDLASWADVVDAAHVDAASSRPRHPVMARGKPFPSSRRGDEASSFAPARGAVEVGSCWLGTPSAHAVDLSTLIGRGHVHALHSRSSPRQAASCSRANLLHLHGLADPPGRRPHACSIHRR